MRFSKQNSFSSQAKHTGWQASRMILEKTIIQLSMSTVSGAPERLFTWKQKELWNIWLPKCRSFLKTERSKEYIAIIIHSNPWKSHKTERDLNIHYREKEINYELSCRLRDFQLLKMSSVKVFYHPLALMYPPCGLGMFNWLLSMVWILKVCICSYS